MRRGLLTAALLLVACHVDAQPHTHSLAACTPTDQQQLRGTCPTTPTLSAALLFTSFRQTHEFEANAHLLKRCSGVLAGAAVYIFNNNPKMSAADLEARATHFDACRRVVLKSATNAGVDYGVMHALEEAYPVVADYDLVVHLHPDVLIYDCEALERALSEAMQHSPNAALLLTEIPPGLRKAFRYNDAFSFDLFAFRPKQLRVPGHTNPFDAFRRTDVHDYICQPLKKVKVCPPEMFLWKLANLTGEPVAELKRGTATHVVHSGKDDPGCLKSDRLGLRHCHGSAQLFKRVVREVVDHSIRPAWVPATRPARRAAPRARRANDKGVREC